MAQRILVLIAATLLIAACSDLESEAPQSPSAESLSVTSYNMGLALNFVIYTNERLVANEALVADHDSDVICFQEVWLDDQVDAIKQALGDNYPHIFTVPPEQVFSETAACTEDEIAEFESCTRAQCDGLTGSDLVACAPVQCAAELGQLSVQAPGCFSAVIGNVGLPNITVDSLVETVTQPAGLFAFDGSLGLMLASKYPLENREFQDFIDDSSGNHRGALYADIVLNDQTHLVGCTHPTANQPTVPYPTSGNHGSWEGESRYQHQQMIARANARAGSNPIFFAGDFNCSFANANRGIAAEFEPNCQLWLDDGFVDPSSERLPCTYCVTENLVLIEENASANSPDLLLDHVFVKNLATADEIRIERVFQDTVAIEALVPPSELQPEDSPKLTHPSDHFGIELDIPLPQAGG